VKLKFSLKNEEASPLLLDKKINLRLKNIKTIEALETLYTDKKIFAFCFLLGD
jgi:hypothetical protein